MVRLLILISIMSLFPGLAAAERDVASFLEQHKGQTLVEINGRVKWLENEQIAGVPWWLVKVKCYKGTQVIAQTELKVWDGHTGQAEGSSTRGYRNPYTGQLTPKTRIGYFVYLDSRKPDPYVVLGQDPPYQDLLAQVQAFTLGKLTLYVYAEGADRFEAEVYASQTPGYALDRTQLIPLATQKADPPLQLFGKVESMLTRRTGPLYVRRFLQPVTTNGKSGYIIIRPDGSVEVIEAKQAGLE
jgi:hypothetical protein